jgi:hypothetical protein
MTQTLDQLVLRSEPWRGVVQLTYSQPTLPLTSGEESLWRSFIPTALHRGLPAAIHKTTQEFPTDPTFGLISRRAPHPAHIRQV